MDRPQVQVRRLRRPMDYITRHEADYGHRPLWSQFYSREASVTMERAAGKAAETFSSDSMEAVRVFSIHLQLTNHEPPRPSLPGHFRDFITANCFPKETIIRYYLVNLAK